MKKSAILGLVAALFMGQSALAQSNQEVSYVEDPAQGYILNSFSNNWFISVEGGMNYYFRHDNSERNFFNRFAPNAGFWVGKWFSPIVALRAGGNFTQLKGLSKNGGVGPYGTFDDFTKYKRNEFGINFDAMVNLTNWWCGYRPGRVYNGILYGGAGMNVQYIPDFKSNGERDGWTNGHNKNLTAHVGLINNFALNKHVSLYLDLRGVVLTDDIYRGATRFTSVLPTTSTRAHGQLPWFPCVLPLQTATKLKPVSRLQTPASPTSSVSSATASTVPLKRLKPRKVLSALSTTLSATHAFPVWTTRCLVL